MLNLCKAEEKALKEGTNRTEDGKEESTSKVILCVHKIASVSATLVPMETEPSLFTPPQASLTPTADSSSLDLHLHGSAE